MVKKIFNLITTICSSLMVILAVLLVGVRLIGYTPFCVLSGSMTPKYLPGDLVYVQKVEFEDLKKGDVITFLIGDDKVVTHRIADINTDNRTIVTKGDANESNDTSPVMYQNVVGRVRFALPKLGYLSDFIQTDSGKYAVIAAFSLLIILFIIPELFKKSGKREEEKK